MAPRIVQTIATSAEVSLSAACDNPHADPALGGYEPSIRRNGRSTPRAVLSPLPHQLAMLLPTQTGKREVSKQAVTPERQVASQVNALKTANEDRENHGPDHTKMRLLRKSMHSQSMEWNQ